MSKEFEVNVTLKCKPMTENFRGRNNKYCHPECLCLIKIKNFHSDFCMLGKTYIDYESFETFFNADYSHEYTWEELEKMDDVYNQCKVVTMNFRSRECVMRENG